MARAKVLFLCTGNSCRSQMAQGLVTHYLGQEWKAYSAGTRPVGAVHPLAIRAMAELGIDIRDYTSKPVEIYREKRFDEVITVCDSAAQECPVWLGHGQVTHLPFPDPAEATGSEEVRLAAFCSVRDDVHRRVLRFLASGRVPSGGQNE